MDFSRLHEQAEITVKLAIRRRDVCPSDTVPQSCIFWSSCTYLHTRTYVNVNVIIVNLLKRK